MCMPGVARWAYRPVPGMARLLISRNELRRPSDRVEGAVLVTLAAAFLAAVVAASFVGAHMYHSQRAADARLRPAVAELGQSGPTQRPNGNWNVPARLPAPGRAPRARYPCPVNTPRV